MTYHRLSHIDFYNNNNKNTTKWIKTNNKIKLYKYLLFTTDDSTNLSSCINYWFSEDNGYWSENYENNNRLNINNSTNINYVDSIGFAIKNGFRVIGRFDSEKEEICDEDEIFTYAYNNKNKNYVKYKNYITNPKFNPDLPKIYDLEYIDLIELFDKFFGFETESHSINSNNPFRIESSNNIYVDLDLDSK
jgi:hypothetical protein